MLRTYWPLALLVVICSLFSNQSAPAQGTNAPATNHGLVEWITLEEAVKRNEKTPKPILIDFYTDWCGWCKRMMQTTYSDPQLAAYINSYFYPVKFNAEGKDTITFLGKTYRPTGTGQRQPHEFAVTMLNGQLSYPTTLFLHGFDVAKQTFQLNMMAPGYLDRTKIEPLLIFVVENAYRNTTYEDFGKNFEKAFRDSTLNEELKKIQWLTPAGAFNNAHVKRQKSIVLINSSWCNSCKVMERTTFIDPSVFAYADSTYRFVYFDAEITDTIAYKGQTYTNPRLPTMPFHQLALALTRNNLILPSVALLDEDDNLIDAIPFYVAPALMKKILYFFGEDIHKSKSWIDYEKSLTGQ